MSRPTSTCDFSFFCCVSSSQFLRPSAACCRWITGLSTRASTMTHTRLIISLTSKVASAWSSSSIFGSRAHEGLPKASFWATTCGTGHAHLSLKSPLIESSRPVDFWTMRSIGPRMKLKLKKVMKATSSSHSARTVMPAHFRIRSTIMAAAGIRPFASCCRRQMKEPRGRA